MNKQELKQWFLNDCQEMKLFWMEAEKTIMGTDTIEQKIIALGNRNQDGWARYELDTGFAVGDAWKAANFTQMDMSTYTPKDFDAGTVITSDPRGKYFRFVFIDGQWYTCCPTLGGTKTVNEAMELQRRHLRISGLNGISMRVWRFNSEI